MNNAEQVIKCLIGQYQNKAQAVYKAGGRPYFLPCEAQTGVHCSTQFAQKVAKSDTVDAFMDLQERCPKGPNHAAKALVWSAMMAVSPFAASSEPCGGSDPCLPGDPTAADPCSGRDPLSQDVANCDC